MKLAENNVRYLTTDHFAKAGRSAQLNAAPRATSEQIKDRAANTKVAALDGTQLATCLDVCGRQALRRRAPCDVDTRTVTPTRRRRRRHGGRDDTGQGRAQGRHPADEASESSQATAPFERHGIAVERAASFLTTSASDIHTDKPLLHCLSKRYVFGFL